MSTSPFTIFSSPTQACLTSTSGATGDHICIIAWYNHFTLSRSAQPVLETTPSATLCSSAHRQIASQQRCYTEQHPLHFHVPSRKRIGGRGRTQRAQELAFEHSHMCIDERARVFAMPFAHLMGSCALDMVRMTGFERRVSRV